MNTTVLKSLAAAPALLIAAFAFAQEPQDMRYHATMAADVAAFHQALAPLWHAPRGEERTQAICRQADQMVQLAGEVRSIDPAALLAALGNVKKQCQAGPAGVDAAFADVHEAFHRIGESRGR